MANTRFAAPTIGGMVHEEPAGRGIRTLLIDLAQTEDELRA